jgi:large subunit ribosomal protein L13
VVDAAGISLGRLAAQVAQVLHGKHKPNFSYNADCGDFVIVLNANKIKLTGRKGEELIYWHTGFPDGLRSRTRGEMLEDTPVKLGEKVIWGMMPKTLLGKAQNKRCKVYAGESILMWRRIRSTRCNQEVEIIYGKNETYYGTGRFQMRDARSGSNVAPATS